MAEAKAVVGGGGSRGPEGRGACSREPLCAAQPWDDAVLGCAFSGLTPAAVWAAPDAVEKGEAGDSAAACMAGGCDGGGS